MPAKLSIGGNIGVPVGPGTKVREGVAEAVGVSVVVGKVCVVGVVVGNENVGRGVFVGIVLCGSASPVLTVEMAVSIISASLIVGVDWPLLQAVSIPATRNKRMIVLPKMFILPLPLIFCKETPNGQPPLNAIGQTINRESKVVQYPIRIMLQYRR